MVSFDQISHVLVALVAFFGGVVIHDLRSRVVRLENSELQCKESLAEVRGAARQHGWTLSDD